MLVMQTREQIEKEGKLQSPPHSYHSFIMDKVLKHKHLPKMFHSDVYYVRAAMEARTGYLFPLPDVERAMKAEGWCR